MHKTVIGSTLLASLLLAGCGTLSQVDYEGQTDEPVWPDPADVRLQTGTYPNIDNLRPIGPGVTRDQLYDLLGRPHFAEGFKTHEWNYLFHFRTPEGVKTCQYKVLFDRQMTGQSFYWKPAECAELLGDKPPAQPFSVASDVGFEFGSAVLTPRGEDAVHDIAEQIKQAPPGQPITVSGHTDRIGNETANQQLSQQRAEAVRQALVANGIPSETIQAQGYGESRPIVQCGQPVRSELIACLAPNRRVEIDVQPQSFSTHAHLSDPQNQIQK